MKIGVLFDLDGTLLDTLEDLKDAVNHALRHYGLPERGLDEVRRFVGNGAAELMRLALPGQPGDPDVGEALACFQAYYKEHASVKTAPYAGVIEAFSHLVWVQNAFGGIRVCVCVLITNAVVKLFKKAVVDKITLVIFMAVALGSTLLDISPVIFVILAAVAGITIKAMGGKKQ